MDAKALEILGRAEDPEPGRRLVDLALVSAAKREPERIAVKLTASNRSCASSEFLPEEARALLAPAFPNAAALVVELAGSPARTPERGSAAARAQRRI